jgi:feruloyl esterase
MLSRMAGLRRYKFSERLAEILGASRRDFRFRVTMLITGGLAAPGPRGPGSPPATPEYAADFLIGAMAAPQQVHMVEAILCYRRLTPTQIGTGAAPGVSVGAQDLRADRGDIWNLPLLPHRLCFGDALARLLDQARDARTRSTVARELFGIWVSRGFPVAAVQLASWSEGRRGVLTQRYELPEGGRPPAWLDPERGGLADPGLFHSVFLPVTKLIEIAGLTAQPDERKHPMITLEKLDKTITKLADLARNRRHRPRWEKFLEAARAARAWSAKVEARGTRLIEVEAFGSNPGGLRMLTYVPQNLPQSAGLVVVLHGCTQTAGSYDYGSGWSTLADRHGFAVLYPEQRRTNNPLRCFNWFRSEDFERESGETLSIRQMVERMVADHRLDAKRVYITGVSAGAAMTSVMLATYPEVFAGGAIIAGLPYRCANGLQEGFECIFQGKTRSAREWGTLVRAASRHQGPWPRVSVWHGAEDATVKPMNAQEIIKQWTNVHGLSAAPAVETTVHGHPYRVWQDANGNDLVEHYSIVGMGHGVPIDPDGVGGCGNPAPWIVDMGISSSHHIAKFWGLTERKAAAGGQDRCAEARPAAAPGGGAGVESGSVIRVDGGPEQGPGSGEGKRPEGDERAGIDLQKIIASALEAAGLFGRRGSDSNASGGSGSPMPIVDIPKILSTSFEAAGLLKGQESRSSGSEREAGKAQQGAGGIDIAAILAKSFEAAGLMGGSRKAAEPASDKPGGLAGSGWEGEGWELTQDTGHAGGDRPVLRGHASSGTGGKVGNSARSISRQFTLGQRPRLAYTRKLSLHAAANILTTANFRVLVDGIAVDEVSNVGMDYEESEWTERTDIDLSRFAGKSVTLSFEVSANSNVFVEVFAKAWVGGITIHDSPGAGRG